ncbi:MAG TPA: DASS family sodium-coupled anion symporter [Candidatus Polarisedimenticolia bacterium]|nr:DASS family sodium-coupled anion symporter [Candidatus Polarisedimenticolia bacterium]
MADEGAARRASRRTAAVRVAAFAVFAALWFAPAPEGLTPAAWHLFAIFAATILAVVAGALPILTAAVLAVAAAVLTGTLSPADAYAGFGNPTILLIIVAFLVARAVVKCGLGQRLGYRAISLFGRSTLGLSYSIFAVDALIAPAFPSSTARSGVLYPLVFSVAEAAGAKPDREDRRRLGRFLMFSGVASLSLSSALWLTAHAANPLGAEIAKQNGVDIGFGSWLLAASVPTLAAMALMPLVLYKVIRPEVTATPEAPAEARRALAALGPITRDQKIVAATFIGMVALWGASATFGIDTTAVAFLGLGVLLATSVLTLGDIAKEGDVLATFIWFAALLTLSDQLNRLGFMEFLGRRLAMRLDGLSPLPAGILLVVVYVLLHYLFVSQTAHLLALFGVFLGVGVTLGVPAAPLAFLLLFATDFFASITPQASSANLLFAGSGYLSQGDLYRLGAIATGFSLLVYLVVGTPWLLWVAR